MGDGPPVVGDLGIELQVLLTTTAPEQVLIVAPEGDDGIAGHGRPARAHRITDRDELGLLWGRRFDLVVLGAGTWRSTDDDGTRRQVFHAAVQHLAARGVLVTERSGGRGADWPIPAFGLDLVGQTGEVVVHRRGPRFNVHDLVHEARATIDRVTADRLAELLAVPESVTVLDTRTDTDRRRVGVIPSSVHVPRTVLEWHVDPDNGYLHPAITSFDQHLVVVCNGGFSSSLAAAHLVRLGFSRTVDLVGGMDSWCRAGLPLVDPPHSHLDPTIWLPPGR